jgi:hypothetical protein
MAIRRLGVGGSNLGRLWHTRRILTHKKCEFLELFREVMERLVVLRQSDELVQAQEPIEDEPKEK